MHSKGIQDNMQKIRQETWAFSWGVKAKTKNPKTACYFVEKGEEATAIFLNLGQLQIITSSSADKAQNS